MRKLLSVLSSTLQGGVRGGLLFVALLATTSLWAQYFKYGDLYYRIESEGEPYTASVTWPWDGRHYYDYGLDTISILDSVKYGERTYLVNTIESSAFKECGDLVSITIPNTITEIGNYAFEGCYNLRTIVIPNSVKSIGIKNLGIELKTNIEFGKDINIKDLKEKLTKVENDIAEIKEKPVNNGGNCCDEDLGLSLDSMEIHNKDNTKGVKCKILPDVKID